MNNTKEINRVLSKVVRTDGCWFWVASINPQGYGNISVKKRTVGAHRFSYEAFVGPIPEGLQIDHLCRNRRCVNPDHLEPVTGKENRHRAALAQTHCKRGHAFTEETTYWYGNKRQCRKCKNLNRSPRSKPASEYVENPNGTHGTRSRYRQGCRCAPCREADSKYQRDYYARKRRVAV